MFFLVLVVFASSCSMHKELEVQVANAELVRIDTLYRYPDAIKQLTWKDDRNTEFISIATMNEVHKVGTKMRMLRQR